MLDNMTGSEEFVVAHIDILGTKSILENDEESFIFSILKMVGRAKELCDFFKKENKYRKVKSIDFELKMFSDNLCFYRQLPQDDTNHIRWEYLVALFSLISSLQYTALIDYDLLIRGAIDKGHLYETKDIIIGTALSNAYQLESNSSVYSRVIVSDSIMKENPEGPTVRNFLRMDSDNKYMIDYLIHSNGVDCDLEGWKNNLLKHKEILMRKLNESKDKHVESKILQSIKYHNSHCADPCQKKLVPYLEKIHTPTGDDLFIIS